MEDREGFIRHILLDRSVENMKKEYPDCNTTNVFTDPTYSKVFRDAMEKVISFNPMYGFKEEAERLVKWIDQEQNKQKNELV